MINIIIPRNRISNTNSKQNKLVHFMNLEIWKFGNKFIKKNFIYQL